MIDFTNCLNTKKLFGGANGKKFSIVYNNDYYMLKLPTLAKYNPKLHYSNSVVCEFLGCKIFSSFKLETQDVLLGRFKHNDKIYDAVACKDFTRNGWTFQDFASMRNTFSNSSSPGYSTELSDILYTINTQTFIDKDLLTQRFWDMFVIDAYIGNWDRHNGNWGFLYNQDKDEMKIAPVFDCGSSLYPQADEAIMHDVLNNVSSSIEPRIKLTPTSALLFDNKRINYYDFMKTFTNKDYVSALIRFENKYNQKLHNQIIQNVPNINENHKAFLTKILELRKKEIIDIGYKSCQDKGLIEKTFYLEKLTSVKEFKPKGLKINQQAKSQPNPGKDQR